MKPDSFFPLENAGWPAFLIEGGGTIRRANREAIDLFGPKVEGDSTSLSAIWSDENDATPELFLARWDRSATAIVPLKFRAKGAADPTFSTCICSLSREGQRRFLFQLFRQSPLVGAGSVENTGAIVEGTRAHKQKLDCALQLTRTVALDFNNALTSILGHASLVLSKMEPNHPWRSSLIEVERAAEKAAEISNHLATFSRQEKETHELNPGNLNSQIRRAVEVFQKSKGKTIHWSQQLENRLYTVKFDEAKLQQAFVKIIENAVEAVGDSGRINVETRNLDVMELTRDHTAHLEPGYYVCVEISDNGSGIAPEVLSRIFEPFFTTKQGHRGLGLAWVYGVVTNHGGGVAISSPSGQGTSVRVYLPATEKILEEETAFINKPGGQKTILLVDDEEAVLTLGQAILSSRGFRVLAANDGSEAVALLEGNTTPIDLVITDLVMPQMSGREFIERVRAFSPHLPIICTSGYLRAPSSERAEFYLQKPFTSQELLQHVKQALEGSLQNSPA